MEHEYNIPSYEEIFRFSGRIWAQNGVSEDNPTEPTTNDVLECAKYLNKNNCFNKTVIALIPMDVLYLFSNCSKWKPKRTPLPVIGSIKNVLFILDDNLKRYTEKKKTFQGRQMYLIPMFLKTHNKIKLEDITVLCISNFLECPKCTSEG